MPILTVGPGEVECRDLKNATDKCYFILHTADCNNAQGFINYLSFIYCSGYQEMFSFGLVMLVTWLVYLFLGLASSANDFFCPALNIIAEKLHMSHNVAGVTLMALGNGAPDIFSSFAGIRQGRSELVFGELFGAGIFVTTVVSGTICMQRVQPFHVMERPFLRDCVFYLSATYFVFWVFYHEYVTLGHAIGFIVLYCVYVAVVIVGRVINKCRPRRCGASSIAEEATTTWAQADEENLLSEENQESDQPAEGNEEEMPLINAQLLNDNPDVVTQPSLRVAAKAEFEDFLKGLRAYTSREWSIAPWYKRTYLVIQAPMRILLNLTIPVNDADLPNKGWHRSLQCFQLALTPAWATWALGYGGVLIGNTLSLPLLLSLCGLGCGVMTAIFTQRDQPPCWHWVFAFFSFAGAIVWIDLFANEILALLFTFGVIFDWSDAILGLTILAWGNSISDFVTDTTMARQNAPRMGFSACYGGPLLNVLLGLGISFSVICLSTGSGIVLTFHNVSKLMSIFLTVSLVSILILLPANKFLAKRWIGIYLYTVYFVFLILAVLNESGIFWSDG